MNKYGEDEIADKIPLGLLIVLFFGLYIGLFAPAIAAIAVVKSEDGNTGLKTFFNRVFKWRVAGKWYVIVIVLSLSMFVLSNLGLVMMGDNFVRPFDNYSYTGLSILFLDSFLLHGGQEELGWRGYAQGKLQIKYSSLKASLLLGILWAFWHIPLFFLEDGQYSQDDAPYIHFALFVIGACTLSLFLTIIYNNTGSTFLAMLFHALVNSFQDILRPETTGSINYHDLTHYISAVIFCIFIILSLITNESNRLNQMLFPNYLSNRSI